VRCGDEEPLKDGESVEEMFVYTAVLTLCGTKLDIDTGEQTLAGRVCGMCTMYLVAKIEADRAAYWRDHETRKG
jgi:hypothetical protein